jgi:hypothetical protein
MAQQGIDVGTSASNGTGDPLRLAFSKVNDNFAELHATAKSSGLTYGNVAAALNQNAARLYALENP